MSEYGAEDIYSQDDMDLALKGWREEKARAEAAEERCARLAGRLEYIREYRKRSNTSWMEVVDHLRCVAGAALSDTAQEPSDG